MAEAATYEEKQVTPGFDDTVGYLERVTVTMHGEAEALFMREWGVAADELELRAIHMRWVADGSDPELEINPVPDLPCWLECSADHPGAVPFWKVAP